MIPHPSARSARSWAKMRTRQSEAFLGTQTLLPSWAACEAQPVKSRATGTSLFRLSIVFCLEPQAMPTKSSVRLQPSLSLVCRARKNIPGMLDFNESYLPAPERFGRHGITHWRGSNGRRAKRIWNEAGSTKALFGQVNEGAFLDHEGARRPSNLQQGALRSGGISRSSIHAL